MCGICGEFTFTQKNVHAETIRSMLSVLHHRGPDDEGMYITKNIGLGHKRLSIIDLDTGKQPISNEDGRIHLIFNGEIYNYMDLKSDLEKKCHVFKTKTDTEVIVHLYEEMGIRCVDRLHGMFAFALWDEHTNEIFLVRDRLGKKPLYYAVLNDTFIFASEIKALLKHPRVIKKINLPAIDSFLTYQYIPAPMTIFNNIYSLLPAHYLKVNQNKSLKLTSYWDIDFTDKLNISLEEAEIILLDKLKHSVRLRMNSDVPLGALLSGGMDSSVVVALMSEFSQKQVKTFSIGFEEESFSELKYARMIAERYNTDHHEFIVKPDAVEILPKLVWHYDQPYADSSALPSYYLARETRKHVTVALNGDGGDENFAGYLRYSANMLATFISKILPPSSWKKIQYLIPEVSQQKSMLRYFKRFSEAAGDPPARRNFAWHCLFRKELKDDLYSGSMKCELKDYNSYTFMETVYQNAKAHDELDKILFTDIKTYLPFDLLVKMDIATMSHSLEVRSPFLDHELMEWTAKLPSGFKMHYFMGKNILKKCFKNYLPCEILKRRKMGFGLPVADWLRKKPLNTFLKDHIISDKSIKRGFFNKQTIMRLINEHESLKVDHGYRLWALLILEIWHRVFIDV